MSCDSNINVYYSSISSSLKIKKCQQHVESILSGKDYNAKFLDLASGEHGTISDLRGKCGKETAMPPQIFNGDTYCGDYEEFALAVEDKELKSFLKME